MMRFKTLFLYIILILPLGRVSPASAHGLTHGEEIAAQIVSGELIVGMKSSASIIQLSLPAGAEIARASHQLNRLNAVVLKVPSGQEAAYVQKLLDSPGVQYAEPNYLVTIAAITPDDPLWPQQYGPTHIQAQDAWTLTTGTSSVTVAIIDSGIDRNHPEFAGRISSGYDFIDGDTDPQDECGHGTHVSGIIAASGNNAMGIAGMAWNVKIMPVRVLNGYCFGSTSDIAEALVWASERGARVINLSLGTSAPSTLMENGVYFAYAHGAAIFAAAGNAGFPTIFYPAAYPQVMAVGATDINDLHADFSNTGTALDLMAPGSDILSTTPYGPFYYETLLGTSRQFGTLSGTSMAAAHASGAAALLASMPQFDTPDKIYEALTGTGLDLDTPGRDDNTGYGLIHSFAALSYTPSPAPPPPPQPVTSYDILDSLTCDNLVQFNWQAAALSGTWLPVFGNDGTATVALPFDFIFGDQTYSEITVSANGYLTFGGVGSARDNFLIPGIAQPNDFLAPFWDDLNPSAGGLLYQATFGIAPNRKYVVEWHQVPRADGTTGSTTLTFEVILFEGSNDIQFQYQTLKGNASDGSSATIGVEYADGTAGQAYSYNKAGAVKEMQALLFRPYATGSTPPSNNCSTYTRHVDIAGGFFDPAPFCVEIPSGALHGPAILRIRDLARAPSPPTGWISLGHYADITLSFSPDLPLSPMPEAYVCYHYTVGDVLHAGGHPENLFLAAYDSARKSWEILPTTVNPAQGLLTARAPHLSICSVVTGQPPAQLPVTGAPLILPTLTILGWLVTFGGILLTIVLRMRRRVRDGINHR